MFDACECVCSFDCTWSFVWIIGENVLTIFWMNPHATWRRKRRERKDIQWNQMLWIMIWIVSFDKHSKRNDCSISATQNHNIYLFLSKCETKKLRVPYLENDIHVNIGRYHLVGAFNFYRFNILYWGWSIDIVQRWLLSNKTIIIAHVRYLNWTDICTSRWKSGMHLTDDWKTDGRASTQNWLSAIWIHWLGLNIDMDASAAATRHFQIRTVLHFVCDNRCGKISYAQCRKIDSILSGFSCFLFKRFTKRCLSIAFRSYFIRTHIYTLFFRK